MKSYFAKMATTPKFEIDTKNSHFERSYIFHTIFFGIYILDFQGVLLVLLNFYDLSPRKQNRTGISMRLACSSSAKKQRHIHIVVCFPVRFAGPTHCMIWMSYPSSNSMLVPFPKDCSIQICFAVTHWACSTGRRGSFG